MVYLGLRRITYIMSWVMPAILVVAEGIPLTSACRELCRPREKIKWFCTSVILMLPLLMLCLVRAIPGIFYHLLPVSSFFCLCSLLLFPLWLPCTPLKKLVVVVTVAGVMCRHNNPDMLTQEKWLSNSAVKRRGTLPHFPRSPTQAKV